MFQSVETLNKRDKLNKSESSLWIYVITFGSNKSSAFTKSKIIKMEKYEIRQLTLIENIKIVCK